MSHPSVPTYPLAMRLFGPFEVRVQGVPVSRWHTRKGQWLLALLTLRHDRPVERSWLAGTLWPDSAESQAAANLRLSLTQLRRSLGEEAHRLHASSPHTLRLDLNGAEVDLLAFDSAIAEGNPASLEAAVGLYRGPLLEGCSEEWVLPERQAREQACLSALEKLADMYQARGEPQPAGDYLRRALALDPLRESLQRAWMQALAASGDYNAAFQVYRELRLRLHQQMQAEPDAATQALYRQLRTQAQHLLQAEPTPTTRTDSTSRPSLRDLPALPGGTVTFLLTDIESSTKLWEAHPQRMRQALMRHDALAEALLTQHQGHLLKSRGEGDSLFCVFARPSDALAGACALQQALLEENWPPETPLRVRMALHTGEADLRDGDYYGPTVNRCARLRAIGQGGQVLLSQATQDLVWDVLPPGCSLKSLGLHRLRDLSRPEPVFQLLHPDLPSDFPPLTSLETLPTNLPVQLTSFIGREPEIAEIKALLTGTRLLTLTGAGGCGKTRLALQVGAEVLEAYPEGVWLVELAALSDPAFIPQALASALGIREEPGRSLTQTVTDALKDRKLLLVLDNCEHLLTSCTELAATLLRACPNLAILATSREGLGIGGEQSYRVPPLSSPDPEHLPVEEKELVAITAEYEAVHLFVERAHQQRSEFALASANVRAVVQICNQLDGIPLAIELAAARIRSLNAEQIVARLDDRFRLLTGGSRTALPRQQTLRATLDWSYELLNAQERLLLQRLSVFAGGWTLEGAECICTNNDEEEKTHPSSFILHPFEILDLLTSLVDKSLVLYEPRGEQEGRYRLLETIRQYGQERLAETQEGAMLQDRHLAYFLDLAEEVEPKLHGPEQAAWMDRLVLEHDNLRAALEWSLKAGERGKEKGEREEAEQSKIENRKSKIAEAGLRLANALVWFWSRGYYAEGEMWLEAALAHNPEAPAQLRAEAFSGLALLAWWHDIPRSVICAEESLALARIADDTRGIARALSLLEVVVLWQGDTARAAALVEEGLPLSREVGEPWPLAISLLVVGWLALGQGDFERATALLEESAAVGRQAKDSWSASLVLYFLAGLTYLRGDLAATRSHAEECLALAREIGFHHGIAHALEMLGRVQVAEGDLAGAQPLLATSLAMLKERGKPQCCAHNLEGFAYQALAEARAERAARLLGGAEAVLTSSKTFLMTTERVRQDRTLDAVRAALSEEAFAAAWAEGQAMTLEQVVEYALEEAAIA